MSKMKLKQIPIWLVKFNLGRLTLAAILMIIGAIPLDYLNEDTWAFTIFYLIMVLGCTILAAVAIPFIIYGLIIWPIKTLVKYIKEKGKSSKK